jgi:hypothetical protein
MEIVKKYGPAILIGVALIGTALFFISQNSQGCGCGGKKEGSIEDLGPL